MLEIIGLFYLCRYFGDVLRQKGRNPLGYQIMTVLLWFGAEIFGAIVGTIVQIVAYGPESVDDGLKPLIYVIALAFALASALFSFLIVKLISPAY